MDSEGDSPSGTSMSPDFYSNNDSMLKMVINSIPQFIFWKDRNSVYMGCNENFAKVAGVGSPEEIVGKTDHDLAWKKEEADFFIKCDREVMESGIPRYHIIEPQKQADGKNAWLDTNKVPIRDNDGNVVGILGTYEDITERMESQKMLARQEAELKATLYGIGDAVISTDIDGRIRRMNSVAEDLTGWDEESARGRPLCDVFRIVNSRTREGVVDPVSQVLESGSIVGLANDTLLIDREGNEHQIADSAAPVISSDGKTSGVVLIFRDVSEEYEIRRSLEESEERLRLAIMATDLGMWDWNIPTGKLIFNDRWAEVLGYRPDELDLDLNTWKGLLHPDDEEKVMKILQTHLDGEIEYYEAEYRMKHKSGQWKWILDMGKVFERGEDGSPIRACGTHMDITEKKLSREELARTKSMLEAAFINSPSGILVAEAPDVKITLANPAAFGIRGGERKNLTDIELEKHSSSWQTFQPDGSPCPPEKLPLSRAVLNGETVKDEEVIIRNEKGEDRWVSANASPILDEEGTVKSGIVVFHDITDRKRTEDELMYRSRLDKVVAEISKMFVSTEEADYNTILKIMGQSVSVNRAYIFRLRENGTKMDNTHEWCSPGTEPQLENLQDLDTSIFPWWMDKLGMGKTIPVNNLEELPDEASSEREALKSQDIKSVLVVPIISKSGSLWGFMGFDDTEKVRNWKSTETEILRVISDLMTSDLERRWTEEAYRESRERYKTLMDNLSDAVMEISFDTDIIYCSPQTEEIFGYSPQEVIGRSYVDFIHPEDIERCMELLGQMIEKRRISNFIYRTIHKDGGVKHISASAKLVKGKDGEITIVGVLRDVTDRIRSREQVEMEKNRAEFYLDLLSHDIGNIHQGLQAWTAIARSKKDNEEEREYAFQKMMELEKRSIKLVRNVLLLSRLKDMKEDLSRIDLIPILEKCISEIRTLFADRDMSISLNAPQGSAEVLAEPVFEEVFFNLLHNGVKFQYGDTVKMDIFLENADDEVRLDICDHGIGIPDDQKDQVFDRFVKGSDYGYSGIGLSLVRELVNRYDGTIQVLDRIEGKPESGARFKITLPKAN